MTPSATNIPRPGLLKRLRNRLLRFFRIKRGAELRVYRGFSNGTTCHVYGHTLTLSPIPAKRFRKFFLYNTIALIRLFIVRPKAGAVVRLEFEGTIVTATTEKDGFFNFKWEEPKLLAAGTYHARVIWEHPKRKAAVRAQVEAEFLVPDKTTYAYISDIDDTFLISHSGNLRKRLFVLLTENARSRRPFDGAVNHYRLLHGIDDDDKSTNAFFYVSSSEWNLYQYIREFIHEHKLPDGVLLLNTIKKFSKLFATGQSNHEGKFMRIVRILESFPDQKFVLLGDDSQRDPYIYASIVEHFPGRIFCVYIRRVGKPEKPEVLKKGEEIKAGGALFCYFAKSEDAIRHSVQVGLAAPPPASSSSS